MSNTENIRCRKCRHVLLLGEAIVLRNAHNKLESEEDDSNKDCASVQDKNFLYISDEELPQFVLDAVTEASWTKGRIQCPGCQARLGLFNFVSCIKCSCNLNSLPAVHLIASKVDWLKPTDLMQRLISVPTQVPTSQVQKSSVVQEESSSSSSASSSVTNLSSMVQTTETSEVSSSCSDLNRERANQTDYVTGQGELMEFAEDNSGWYEFLTQELSMEIDDNDEHADISIPPGPEGRKIRRELRRMQRKIKNKDKVEKKLQEKEEWEKEQKSKQEEGDKESLRIPGYLTCPICLELLHAPCKTQPCNHVFCEQCLRLLGGENTQCPLCRQMIGQCIPDREKSQEIRENFPVLNATRQEYTRKMTKFDRPLPWTSDHRMNQAQRRWYSDIQVWDIRSMWIEEYREMPWWHKLLFWGLLLKLIYHIVMRIYIGLFMIDITDFKDILEEDRDMGHGRIRKFPSHYYDWI